jgi:hypothetical protein
MMAGPAAVNNHPSITVQAATFEQAKAEMESVLSGTHPITSEDKQAVSKGQTA